ncbi:anti-anti-sigma factor [Nonomuraea solani]|uniref:Anti-anti-sigma factor n=1 Tax=Nonomuraea solani TaxID=1144553 RepID=A0A1H6EGZ1_9ACTN|nr:STAS domain-containing protein [Nonomuraea solani]SEG96074.1 anti-anti-sigma factor [Nonomuraea solani]
MDSAASPSADELQHVLRPGEHVVLDLSELTLIDSSGLHVLLDCHRHCTEQQRSLHLSAVRSTPARLLRVTRVDQHPPMHAESTGVWSICTCCNRPSILGGSPPTDLRRRARSVPSHAVAAAAGSSASIRRASVLRAQTPLKILIAH